MYEILVAYDLGGMKAIARHTLYKSVCACMALSAAALIGGVCLGKMPGLCLGAAGGFLLIYMLILYARFPGKLLRSHVRIAPEARYIFDPERIMCVCGEAVWTWSWDQLRRIVWTRDYAILVCRGDEAMALPRSALSQQEGLEAFLCARCPG